MLLANQFLGEISGKAVLAASAAGLVAKYLSHRISCLSGESAGGAALIAGATAALNDTTYKIVDFVSFKTGFLKDRPFSRTVCGFAITSTLNAGILAGCALVQRRIGLTPVQVGVNMYIASAAVWSIKFPLLVIDMYRSFKKP